jgi:hypothetical protein
MELLSEEKVEWVRSKIFITPLPNQSLEDELLDHFCCFIEERISNGLPFEQSFEDALQSIAPNGVTEIHDELITLSEFNYQTNMKRILFISAFIFTSTLSLSFLMKHHHFDNKILNIMAFFTLALFVVPSIAIMAYRNRKMLSNMDIVRTVFGCLSGFTIATGMIFKVFYMPGANIIFSLGVLLLVFIFLPIFFYQLYARANI